jgi:acyl carrier protein
MPVTERDFAAWAARIRPHFEPRLQDTAETVARMFAPSVGSKLKDLRPETRMEELLQWVKESGRSSLDWVELIMFIEEELPSEVSDEFAESLELRTFRDFVEHLHSRRKR